MTEEVEQQSVDAACSNNAATGSYLTSAGWSSGMLGGAGSTGTVTITTGGAGASGVYYTAGGAGYTIGVGTGGGVGSTTTPYITSPGSCGPTGSTFGWHTPKTTSINVGSKFKITGPSDGNDGPVKIECGNRSVDIDDLISMASAFKMLLGTVATDKDFCEKHPEISEMAQAYLMEELRK